MGEMLANCESSRRLIVYDTFEGHPKPNPSETDVWGNNMLTRYHKEVRQSGSWAAASFETVQSYLSALFSNSYVVKEIISNESLFENINNIACLRLDMDWYEPTLAALNLLYPKMVKGSVLIIDDYGHHSGARKAVNEFFQNRTRPFLVHVNYSCLSAVL